MDHDGIRCEVTHVEGTRDVGKAVLRFGDGHQVEVSRSGRKVTVRLVGRDSELSLDARGTYCEFERAVNLLKLYMGK